jgi:predicted DNA-binding protein
VSVDSPATREVLDYLHEHTSLCAGADTCEVRIAIEPLVDETEQLRDALSELVRLKDGPRDDAYRAEKDAVWEAARTALGLPHKSDDPEESPFDMPALDDRPQG